MTSRQLQALHTPPVAMVQLIVNNADNDPEQADGDKIASIHFLQVLKSRQGRGIGAEFMTRLEEIARTMGKLVLTLGVDDSNSRAIELYLRIGYKQFKTIEGREPGEYGLIMRKEI